MLTETAVPIISEAMRGELARHMRLSTGFAVDQMADVESAFRAALAHLEKSLSLCLLPRRFTWRGQVDDCRPTSFPIGPVRALVSVSGAVDAGRFTLEQESARTRVRSPVAGTFDFTFDAGFGEDWVATPADLRRAVLTLSAEFFDNRRATVPSRESLAGFGVEALIRPWRQVRLGATR